MFHRITHQVIVTAEGGLCSEHEDPDMWFRESMVAEAKQVCAACPILMTCRMVAERNREGFGVWGGTTPKERGAARTVRRLSSGGRRQSAPA